MEPPIRPARADELPAVTALLVRAFAEDPPLNWVLQGGPAKERSFRAFFQLAVERLTFPFGGVYLDPDYRGAALWAPPGTWRLRWHQRWPRRPSSTDNQAAPTRRPASAR